MGIPENHPAILAAMKNGLVITPSLVARPVETHQERVTLTLPPSANELFANARKSGRVKTKKYRDWLTLSAPLVAKLKPPTSYPCVFLFCIVGKVNLGRDGGNMEKALLDCCVQEGVITDDSLKYVRGGCWQYEETKEEPHVLIWFEAMP